MIDEKKMAEKHGIWGVWCFFFRSTLGVTGLASYARQNVPVARVAAGFLVGAGALFSKLFLYSLKRFVLIGFFTTKVISGSFTKNEKHF
jgi:hypothetical protein